MAHTEGHSRLGTLVAVLALALAAAATWWGWLGWDDTYYTDPETGRSAGPYRAWQVAGCVLTLLAVAVAAYRWLHPLVVSVVVTLAFTAAFASTALPADESGLAGVGVVLVFVGTATASVVVGAVALGIRSASG